MFKDYIAPVLSLFFAIFGGVIGLNGTNVRQNKIMSVALFALAGCFVSVFAAGTFSALSAIFIVISAISAVASFIFK